MAASRRAAAGRIINFMALMSEPSHNVGFQSDLLQLEGPLGGRSLNIYKSIIYGAETPVGAVDEQKIKKKTSCKQMSCKAGTSHAARPKSGVGVKLRRLRPQLSTCL